MKTAENLGESRPTGAAVDLKASIAWIDLGDVELELIEPIDLTSEFGRFLDENGPGVHHVALSVADYGVACSNLAELGVDELLSADVLGTSFRSFDTVATLGSAISFATAVGEP